MNKAMNLFRLGQNIRHCRHTRQLRQCELAAGASCHPDTLSRIERGLSAPSVELLIRIARALKCPVRELLDGV